MKQRINETGKQKVLPRLGAVGGSRTASLVGKGTAPTLPTTNENSAAKSRKTKRKKDQNMRSKRNRV
jgi:hypothetical protein